MKTLRILIVEDEPLVAMDLEMMVTEIVTAAVVVEASVAYAETTSPPRDMDSLECPCSRGG
jgi:hypothetical protein